MIPRLIDRLLQKALAVVAIALAGPGLLAGCAAPETPPAPPAQGEVGVPTSTPAPTATVDPRLDVIYALWETSRHADTYALEKGPNTYCARCHSPANGDPAAVVDPPPNCVSCKFAFEDEMRVAEGNPPVPEEEWQDIHCGSCHPVENGVVSPSLAWFDPSTGYHEEVHSNSDLCQHCHRDTETLRHLRVLGEEIHTDFECTDCHNPHSTQANCTACHEDAPLPLPTRLPEHIDQRDTSECRECHLSVDESHMRVMDQPPVACMDCHGYLFSGSAQGRLEKGHSASHVDVACVACHDATGLEVGPVEGQALWMTYRTTELLGRSSRKPYQSHNLTRAVDCARCHYADNPWALEANVGEDE